jgi:hypothetical protein
MKAPEWPLRSGGIRPGISGSAVPSSGEAGAGGPAGGAGGSA